VNQTGHFYILDEKTKLTKIPVLFQEYNRGRVNERIVPQRRFW
jgi:hypothetical protein